MGVPDRTMIMLPMHRLHRNPRESMCAAQPAARVAVLAWRVSLIATVLKFGDRTQIGAVHLATSLVADLQLVAASVVWVWAKEISAEGMTAVHTAIVISLSGGALLANLVSVVLLVIETVTFHRG